REPLFRLAHKTWATRGPSTVDASAPLLACSRRRPRRGQPAKHWRLDETHRRECRHTAAALALASVGVPAQRVAAGLRRRARRRGRPPGVRARCSRAANAGQHRRHRRLHHRRQQLCGPVRRHAPLPPQAPRRARRDPPRPQRPLAQQRRRARHRPDLHGTLRPRSHAEARRPAPRRVRRQHGPEPRLVRAPPPHSPAAAPRARPRRRQRSQVEGRPAPGRADRQVLEQQVAGRHGRQRHAAGGAVLGQRRPARRDQLGRGRDRRLVPPLQRAARVDARRAAWRRALGRSLYPGLHAGLQAPCRRRAHLPRPAPPPPSALSAGAHASAAGTRPPSQVPEGAGCAGGPAARRERARVCCERLCAGVAAAALRRVGAGLRADGRRQGARQARVRCVPARRQPLPLPTLPRGRRRGSQPKGAVAGLPAQLRAHGPRPRLVRRRLLLPRDAHRRARHQGRRERHRRAAGRAPRGEARGGRGKGGCGARGGLLLCAAAGGAGLLLRRAQVQADVFAARRRRREQPANLQFARRRERVGDGGRGGSLDGHRLTSSRFRTFH
ncbi:hypothetical protein EMIHUDRAFT_445595, partial [Emiliania huxleyi CCMP1516]|uniref:Uncharacterized protein n=2 Tax=Emiliania huxleyi TaxID=2903 RepID=A0A0D3IVH4_EMIH1